MCVACTVKSLPLPWFHQGILSTAPAPSLLKKKKANILFARYLIWATAAELLVEHGLSWVSGVVLDMADLGKMPQGQEIKI